MWNDAHAGEDVIPALEKTMADLQTDYLDLYLIHWPVAIKKNIPWVRSAEDLISLEELPLSETWQAMKEVADKGMVRHIGVSNFSKNKLESLITETSIKPEVNQVESHPYLQQRDLLTFCKSHHIHITAYSPLGSGDRPQALETDNESKLLDNPTVKSIADVRGLSRHRY